MAFVHGKDAVFKIDDSGGTLRDISSYVKNVSGLPSARELHDSTTLGQSGRKSQPGLQAATFTVSGLFDSTATTGAYTVLKGLRTTTATSSFEYGPEGGTTGKVKISGECWLETLEVDAAVDDLVLFSATLRLDGTITDGTFA